MFILDSSGSMENAGLNSVEDAVETFVDILGQPVSSGGAPESGIAAVHFSDWADTGLGAYYNVVTDDTTIDAYVSPGGAYRSYSHRWTNWEAAFDQANSLRSGIGNPDFVFFLTDGQPTRNNDTGSDGGGQPAGNYDFDDNALAAVDAADALRAAVAGSDSVYGIGVGSDFTGPDQQENIDRLELVVDDVIATSFVDLAETLADLINTICAPSITVEKTVSPTQLNEPGGTATFTVTVTNTSERSGTDVQMTVLEDDVYETFPENASCEIDGVSVDDPFDAWIPYGESLVCTWQNEFTDKAPGFSETDTVTAKAEDPNTRETPTVQDSATVTVVDVPSSIRVTKSVNGLDARPEPGGLFTFDVLIENTSAVDTVTIDTISDAPYGSLTGINPGIVSSTCTVNQDIAPGNSYGCSFTVDIQGEPGAYPNTVTASGVDDDGEDVSDSDGASVTITDVAPTITVAKSANPTTVAEPGGNVTFTVDVTNTSAENVTITSLVDDIYGTLDGDADCEVGTVLAANGGTCSFDFAEPVTGNAGDTHTNTVTATAVDNDQTEATASDDATVTITDVAPAISVVKSASPSSINEPGGNVTFTVVVTNNSAENVTITSLVDDIYGTLDGDADCEVGTELAANGGACAFDFVELVTGNAGDTHTNTVTATAVDDDQTEATASDDATVTILDVAPSITVTKTPNPSSVDEPGADVTFTFVVTNNSGEAVTITSLSDSVYGTLDGDADCEVGTELAANGGSCSFDFTGPVSGNAGDVHVNTVTAIAIDDDGTTATDTATARVTIDDVLPVISVDKTANPTKVAEPGGMVTFSVVVTNPGTAEDLTLTSLVDDVYGDLNGQGDCSVPQTIAKDGGTYTCSFEGEVLGDGGDVHVNTVTATAEDDDDNETTDEDDATVDILTTGIDIEKTGALELGDDGIASPGDVITYEFTITNTGDATLFDVEVEDLLPGLSDISCGAVYGGDDDLIVALASTLLGILDPGQSVDCTANYEITQDDIDAGQVDNCAVASGTTVQRLQNEFQTGEDEDGRVSDEDCFTTPLPWLAISKLVEDPDDGFVESAVFPAAKTDATWQIEVKNPNSFDLTSMTLTDANAPACETAFDDALDDAGYDPGVLPAGASVVFECESTVPANQLASNTASTQGVDPWQQTIGPVEDTARISRVASDASIGDTVWVDENENGVQDNGEKGLANATVRLTPVVEADSFGTAAVSELQTNSNGLYIFSGLEPGTYTVELVTSSISIPEDSELKLTTPGKYTVTLELDEAYLDADFGVVTVLPETGISADQIGLIGLALLLAGGIAVLVSRPRRKDDGPDQMAA